MAMQLPSPSHATPAPSAQTAPFAALVTEHAFAPVQWTVAQTVPVAVQLESTRQATQLPWSLQSFPPLSEHCVLEATFDVPQALFVQVFVRHAVVCAGQSEAIMHSTQVPLPSHTSPPLLPHFVPATTLAVPQHAWAVQVFFTQSLAAAGQSVSTVHCMAPLEQAPPVPPVPPVPP